ncbi:CIA30 family protein [Jannaschia formosa]|uniref:CIA30 family protein n=1 Tax=Jannaschia formosa TaxID=2259592 RepID=UPI000E1B9C15|nr:CIA30 family protein [Jannaschia formosa]TFL17443.1 NADH:ubiquinone oxidoreductase complex i intermediate-associated protein 30 [Jannaschia formosa]
MTRRDLLTFAAVSTRPGAVPAAEATTPLALDWGYVADGVMGGVSTGRMTRETLAGVDATRLTGDVSTENDGGFIQLAADLPDGSDPAAWAGLEIDVLGNGEGYDLRLRTTALTRPWQSFRLAFDASPEWRTLRAPWSAFAPHRTEAAFDPAQLRRLGILAVGRAFKADIAVGALRLWR